MTPATLQQIGQLYGDTFKDEAARAKSYGLLESIVAATPKADGVPNTPAGLRLLEAELKTMDDRALAFLITHAGFLPDHYGNDSADETLYSKLVEAVLCEWGRRLDFTMTLPTAKSSTEDVTFMNSKEVVVADAKSFRLGRSQGAPNTKDIVKPEDYTKWLGNHQGHTALGGLIAFPSKHDFQKGGDAYLYASNAQVGKRILLLFYEHIAFLLLNKATSGPDHFFAILRTYDKVFAVASKDRDAYWLAIDKALEMITKSTTLSTFLATSREIVDECVLKAVEKIEARIKRVQQEERDRVENLDPTLLKEALIASEVLRRTETDQKRLENIRKFRIT